MHSVLTDSSGKIGMSWKCGASPVVFLILSVISLAIFKLRYKTNYKKRARCRHGDGELGVRSTGLDIFYIERELDYERTELMQRGYG